MHDETPWPDREARALNVRRLSDVQPEPLDPLWPGYLYRGKLSLFAGLGEIGKTYALCDIAARGSRGGLMPDGATVGTFRTLFVTAEDGAADTLRPRIDRLGGDPSLIYAVDAEDAPGLTLGNDLGALEQTVIDTQTDALVLDPVNAFIGGKLDSKQDNAVRSVLGPLIAMAMRRRVAVGAICHFGKAEHAHLTNKILGSVGFSNVARVVVGFTADPDTPGRSLMCVIKSNLGPKPDPLAYRIEPASGRITWASATGLDVQAAFNAKPSTSPGKLPQAIAWLQAFLAPHGSAGLPSDDVIAQGKAAGFGRDVLFAAKKSAGILARKGAFAGGWFWLVDEASGRICHTSDASTLRSSPKEFSKDRKDDTDGSSDEASKRRSVGTEGPADSSAPTLRRGRTA